MQESNKDKLIDEHERTECRDLAAEKEFYLECERYKVSADEIKKFNEENQVNFTARDFAKIRHWAYLSQNRDE